MIGWLNPTILLTLVPVAIIAIFLFFQWRVRSRIASQLGLTTNSKRRWMQTSFFILLVGLIISAARPYYGSEQIKIQKDSSDLILMVDVSLSMNAADISPSRITTAKRKIHDLLELNRERGRADRIGIILYAGESYLYCPLTSDYQAVELFARSINTNLISWQGSDLDGALRQAIESFDRTRASKPAILLMSDGEDLLLDTQSVVDLANSNGVKIFALGIGTDAGKPIEIQPGKFITDKQGQVVISRLNKSALSKIATETGGLYVTVSVDRGDLEQLLSAITPQLKANTLTTEQEITVYNEIGPKIVYVLAVLWLPLTVAFKRMGVLLSLILIIAIQPCMADSIVEARLKYDQGDFEKAQTQLERLYKENPDDWRIVQSLGSTYYKLGKFDQANELFKKLPELSDRSDVNFDARYDQGNALLMQKDYQGAIEAYNNALKINPSHDPTKFNLNLAKALLAQKQEQQSQQEQSSKSTNEKNDSNQNQNQESSKDREKDKSDQQAENQSSQDQEHSNADSQSEQQSDDSSSPKQNNNSNPETKEQKPTSDSPKDHPDEGNGDRKESEDSNKQQSKSQPNSNSNSGSGEEIKPKSDQNLSESSDSSSVPKVRALPQSEAQRWLQSLPEAPALLQTRQRRGAPRNEQNW